MHIAYPGLASHLERAARDQTISILTPSALLASVASAEFSVAQLAQGIETWQRPQINSVEGWLLRKWNEARYGSAAIPALLSPAQETLLWQKIIESDGIELFDVHAAATLAAQAYRLTAEWHIPTAPEAWNEQEDAAGFHRWRERFRDRCRQEQWTTRADLWRLVPRWMAEGICPPGEVVFAGSFRLSPALKNLQTALGKKAFFEEPRPKPQASAPIHECISFNQQVEYAARWARGVFESRESGQNASGQSIAVFIPGLTQHRSLVERTFRYVLYPPAAHALVRGNRSFFNPAGSAFHIASATPLRDEPIVAGALLLLELARPRIGHAQAGAILRSPFVQGAAEERDQRAYADLRLRKRRELDFSLHALESVVAESPIFAKVLFKVARLLSARGQNDLAAAESEFPAWARFFADLLGATGWPGDQDLSAFEQEAVEGWKNALSELASLGLVSDAVTFDAALAHLGRLLTRGRALVGDWFSPIQILDAAEAPDLSFHAACIVGMSEETWPSPANAQPLVPLKLQRAAGVPESTPKGLAAERHILTKALFQAAPQAIATFSGKVAPIAQSFVVPQSLGDEWPGKLPWQSYAPADLDAIIDVEAPPYIPNGDTRGGTGVLKAQSQCAFKAFAEYRLDAQAPEEACFGYDARDRGNFAHIALKQVWQQLENSDRLRLFPEEDLRKLVHDAVNEAVRQRDQNPLSRLTTIAERERLETVVCQWLALEKGRKQAFAVEKVEEARTVSIGGLTISLRFDRIDRLKDNRLVLIDYKTGEVKSAKLESGRPAEPQLLVYAAAVGADNVDGIYFGQVASRSVKAVGLSRIEHFAEKKKAKPHRHWHSFITESVATVEKLANQFVAGVATVEPLKGACEYCQLKPLCRIAELGGEPDGADVAD